MGKVIIEDGFVNINNYLHIKEIKERESFEVRWTLLEAYLKAEGGGFASYPPDESSLSLYRAASFTVELDGAIHTISLLWK
jgi:phosphopantetheinyl transferase